MKKEKEILSMLMAGKKYKEIEKALSVSSKTIAELRKASGIFLRHGTSKEVVTMTLNRKTTLQTSSGFEQKISENQKITAPTQTIIVNEIMEKSLSNSDKDNINDTEHPNRKVTFSKNENVETGKSIPSICHRNLGTIDLSGRKVTIAKSENEETGNSLSENSKGRIVKLLNDNLEHRETMNKSKCLHCTKKIDGKPFKMYLLHLSGTDPIATFCNELCWKTHLREYNIATYGFSYSDFG